MLLLLLLVTPLPALSEIFRCTNDHGQITFSEEPCPEQHSETIDIDIGSTYSPPQYSTPTGLRPGEIELIRDIDRRGGSNRRNRRLSQKFSTRAAATPYKLRQEKCLMIKKRINNMRSEMSRGYRGGRGDSLNKMMAEARREKLEWCR